MGKTTYKDIFDFSDDNEIKKAIEAIRALNAEHERLITNVAKGRTKFTDSIKSEGEAIVKLTGGLKKLDAQREDNQDTIIKSAKAVDESAKKVNELSKAIKGADQIEKEFGKSVESLRSRLKAQRKEFELLKDPLTKDAQKAKELGLSMRNLKNEIKEVTAITKTQNNAFERSAGSYNALTKRTNELRAQLKNLPGAFDKSAKGSLAFKKRSRELTTEINNNNTKLKQFDKTLGDNFRNVGNYKSAIQGAGSSLRSFALQLTAATLGLQALLMAGKEGFKTFVDFEFTMAQVKAISGATADEFERLDGLAKDLGSTTASTASDIASLELELSKLGFSTQEIIDATPAINALAIAMGEDLGETAKTVASTINAFGLEAADAASISNKFAAIANKSAVSLNDMGTVIGNVGKVAASAGISLDTTLALVGKLKDNAQDASTASTSLRNILLELSTTNSKLSKQVGFAVKSEEDLFKALDILADKGIDVNKVLDEGTDSLSALGEAGEVTGKRTATSLLILVDMRDKVKELSNEVLVAEDALDKFTAIMAGTTKVALAETASAMQGFAIELFTALKPAIKAVLGVIIQLFSAMKAGVQIIQEQKDLFIALGVAILAFNTQMILNTANTIKNTIVKKASTIATKLFTKATWESTKAMLANPVGLLALAFIGLALALKKAEETSEVYTKIQEGENEITERAAFQTKVLDEAKNLLAETTKELGTLTDEEIEQRIDTIKGLRAQTLFEILLLEAKNKSLAITAEQLTFAEKINTSIASTIGATKQLARVEESKNERILESTRETTEKINALKQSILDLDFDIDKFEEQFDKNREDRSKKQKARTDQELSDARKLALFRLELQAQAIQREIDLQEKASKEFLQLSQDLKDKLIDIELFKREGLLAESELTESAKLLIIEKSNEEIEKISRNSSKVINKQREEDAKKAEEEAKKALENIKKFEAELAAILKEDDEDDSEFENQEKEKDKLKSFLLSKQGGEQIKAFKELEQLRTDDLISENEYIIRLEQIRDDYEKGIIDGMKEIFGSSREIQELETAMMKRQNDKRKQDAKETWKAIGAFAMEAFNVATQLASDTAQRQVEDSEFRLERLEAERTRDVELAGDNEEQKRLINEKAAIDRAVLEEQRRKALIKQAKIEKATALLGAIVNTARGVAAALPIIPLSILVGALGAVQIATIAAQPIPAFAKGTTNAPSGYAIVAEEGPEAIKSKDGSVEIAYRPQKKLLKGGETIYTAKQTRSISETALNSQFETVGNESDVYVNNNNSINEQSENRSFEKELMKEISNGQKEVIKAVKGMERFSFEGTARGLRAYAKSVKGRTELLNSRYG